MMDNENAPLLPSAPPMLPTAPPQYTDLSLKNQPTDLNQPPPPYNMVAPVSSPSPRSLEHFAGGNSFGGSSRYVQCRVCQHIINVQQGTTSRVVKCSNCQEATPIADPPPGKKYVRCPCNCLLTCSATASRVICPRPNCKRTIGVGTSDTIITFNTGRLRVNCGRCNRSILWPPNASVARCPHCRCRSYLYRDWMMRRAIVSAFIGLIMLAAGIGVTKPFENLFKGCFYFFLGSNCRDSQRTWRNNCGLCWSVCGWNSQSGAECPLFVYDSESHSMTSRNSRSFNS